MPVTNEDLRILISDLSGQMKALVASVEGKFTALEAKIDYGDRSAMQLITANLAETLRAHTRIDAAAIEMKQELNDRDNRIDKNRRMIWTTVAAPLLVTVIGAVLIILLKLN